MDADSLRCTELNTSVDTALLLTQALSEVSSLSLGSDSNSTEDSPPSSDDSSGRTKDSTDESTNAPIHQNAVLQKKGETLGEALRVPYTVVPDTAAKAASEWNWADGFPFPCPVVRDPTSRSGFYIPGEVLRLQSGLHLNLAPRLTRQPATPLRAVDDRSAMEHRPPRTDKPQKTISLREVIRQTPIQLSNYRDGDAEGNFYEAWLYGDPRQPLRDRFARMDRNLRAKFIGLKNSSARVRDKVRQKKTTSYKEVAEELVEEIGLANMRDKRSALEAENLKRRVYDVLNVFEAVGLIVKDQKNVYWRGNTAPREKEIQSLEQRASRLEKQLQERQHYLEHIGESYNSLAALSERNKQQPENLEDPKLPLPFILLHAPESVPIDVKIAPEPRQVQLVFHSDAYSVEGDMWVLRHMGLPRIDGPSSRSFFQELFREEFARDSNAAGRNSFSPNEALDPKQQERVAEDACRERNADVFSFLNQTMESNVDEMKMETTEAPLENEKRRLEAEEPPRKRSRSSSVGESEDPKSPRMASP